MIDDLSTDHAKFCQSPRQEMLTLWGLTVRSAFILICPVAGADLTSGCGYLTPADFLTDVLHVGLRAAPASVRTICRAGRRLALAFSIMTMAQGVAKLGKHVLAADDARAAKSSISVMKRYQRTVAKEPAVLQTRTRS